MSGYAIRRLFSSWALLWLFGGSPAHSEDLIVITTQRVPKVDRVIDVLSRQTEGRLTVRVHDMQGKQQQGARMVKELASSLPDNSKVVSLGTPASLLVAEHLQRFDIVGTFVNTTGSIAIESSGGRVVSSEPGIQHMARALMSTWPKVRTVGVLFDKKRAGEIERRLVEVDAPEIVWSLLPVDSAGEVVNRMQNALPAVEAFIFVRDPTVLNRGSIQDVVTFLNKYRIPAVGYSRYLVGAGFPSAVVVDESQIGRALAAEFLDSNGATELNRVNTIYVSREFAGKLNLTAADLPRGVKLL